MLVCDAGLMSTSTAWLLVADHLDPAVTVLLYDRAGYRSSLRGGGRSGSGGRVILVDPMHPRGLVHSRRQREGARAVDMTMKLGPWTALFGGGLLLDEREMFAFARVTPMRSWSTAAGRWTGWRFLFP